VAILAILPVPLSIEPESLCGIGDFRKKVDEEAARLIESLDE